MARITREYHDRLLATIQALKAVDPELTTRAMVRGRKAIGSPEQKLDSDLNALDCVASSYATGIPAAKAQIRRAAVLAACPPGFSSKTGALHEPLRPRRLAAPLHPADEQQRRHARPRPLARGVPGDLHWAGKPVTDTQQEMTKWHNLNT